MPRTADSRSKAAPKLKPADDAMRLLVDEAIQRNEKLAESGVEMAKLFLEKGKRQIAKRRLREIIEQFGASAAAGDARRLLKTI